MSTSLSKVKPILVMGSNYGKPFNMTHFIRIPLLNQTSSSQIQNTLDQVASDPISATVPPLAWASLQRLSISVTSLCLPTQRSSDRAIALLKQLGSQDWQGLLSKAQTSSSNAPMSSTSAPPPFVVSAPFQVNLPRSIPCASPRPCFASRVLVVLRRLLR